MEALSLSGLVLALAVNTFSLTPAAKDSAEDVRDARGKPAIRGAIVYKTYCARCHGEKGDGEARATKLYGKQNLILRKKTAEEREKIIRLGGEGVGRSKFMPTWQDELSDQQIGDVLSYLNIVDSSISRGEIVFKTNCVLCHGVKANGKGRVSGLFDPPPANLTMSDKSDAYKIEIVTKGGAAMGRSAVMPIWGGELSAQEISDVVAFLRTVLVKRPLGH